MIHWLLQDQNAHPHLAAGQPPGGLLTPPEADVFSAFCLEKRRRDWLLGRWTAKQLVRQVLADGGHPTLTWNQFSILAGADGAPLVRRYPSENGQVLPLTISISHSQDTAACALIPLPGWPLGIDLEWITPRSAAFIADYFTHAEQAHLQRGDPSMAATLATATWSAKEAALKAIRQGLKVDTRAVSCLLTSQANPQDSWSPFTIIWDQGRLAETPPPLSGWWRVTDRHVLTIAAQTERERGPLPSSDQGNIERNFIQE